MHLWWWGEIVFKTMFYATVVNGVRSASITCTSKQYEYAYINNVRLYLERLINFKNINLNKW